MTLYIGTATVNNWKYLELMLNSLKSKHDFEVLIIDNGSEEDTVNWIKNSGYNAVYNSTNFGVSKAWNQIIYWALSHEDMELVLVPNNDIVLHPQTLDNLMESVLIHGKGGVSGLNIGAHPEMLDTFTNPTDAEHRYNPAMNFSLFGLTKPTITRVGLFDEGFKLAYFEDNDYHTRMKNEDINNSCDTWAPFTHFGSRTIKEGGVNHHAAFRANREYFMRKWGFLP